MMAVLERAYRRFDNVARSFEVRLTDPKVDDVPALGGELVRASEHLERGFSA